MLYPFKPPGVCTSLKGLCIPGEQRKAREFVGRLPANSKAYAHGQWIVHVFKRISNQVCSNFRIKSYYWKMHKHVLWNVKLRRNVLQTLLSRSYIHIHGQIFILLFFFFLNFHRKNMIIQNNFSLVSYSIWVYKESVSTVLHTNIPDVIRMYLNVPPRWMNWNVLSTFIKRYQYVFFFLFFFFFFWHCEKK